MASENTKYSVSGIGCPLQAIATSKPNDVAPDEVMIRLKDIAINPADCKMIDYGHRVTSWPIVPGLDGAGVVEFVGHNVKNFERGDEVLAAFSTGDRSGSYQTFAIVPEMMVAKKPNAWSFEEAATVGVSYRTALAALGIGLEAPLPFLQDGPETGFIPCSVLILGGSSALGAAAIQLVRLTAPGCVILATSSPKSHNHIINKLGAHKVFDRHSSSLITDLKFASPGSRGVDAIIDAVGACSTKNEIFDVFDPDGPKRYAQVWTGDEEIEVPSGVRSVRFRSRDLSKLQGNKNAMLALQTLLDENIYKLPLPMRKVGDGLDGLKIGLELMRKGVSGEKLVVGL